MKSAKTISPFLLAAVVFVAVVFALTFTLGRQPPGATVESTTGNAATEPVAGETANAKTETQAAADAKAQAEAKERRRRITNQVINTAIGVSVLQ